MTFKPVSQLVAPRSVLSLRGLTFVLTLAGAAGAGTAHAADESQNNGTVHTSWAASVRAALSNHAHKAASWTQNGVASWYGRHFHGRRTSSGAIFDTNTMTAAHPSLPIGTKLLVTSQDTGQSVVVTVNDRGPFNNRIIDLSHAAAAKIGMLHSGTAHVTIAQLPKAVPGVPASTGPEMEVAEADPADTSAQAIENAENGSSVPDDSDAHAKTAATHQLIRKAPHRAHH